MAEEPDIRPILENIIASPHIDKETSYNLLEAGTPEGVVWLSANQSLNEAYMKRLTALVEAEDDEVRHFDDQFRQKLAESLLSNTATGQSQLASVLRVATTDENVKDVAFMALAHPYLPEDIYTQFITHAITGEFSDDDAVGEVFEKRHLDALLEDDEYVVALFDNALLGTLDADTVMDVVDNYPHYLEHIIENPDLSPEILERLFERVKNDSLEKPPTYTHGVHTLGIITHPNAPESLRAFNDEDFEHYKDADFLSRDGDTGKGNSYDYPVRDLSIPAVIAVVSPDTPEEVLNNIVDSGQSDAVYEMLHARVPRTPELLARIVRTYAHDRDIHAVVVTHHDVTAEVLGDIAHRFTSYIAYAETMEEDDSRLMQTVTLNPHTPQEEVDALEDILTQRNLEYPGFEYRRNDMTIRDETTFSPETYKHERMLFTVGAQVIDEQRLRANTVRRWISMCSVASVQPYVFPTLSEDVMENPEVTTPDWIALARLVGIKPPTD